MRRLRASTLRTAAVSKKASTGVSSGGSSPRAAAAPKTIDVTVLVTDWSVCRSPRR
jgi:hypothetical protein